MVGSWSSVVCASWVGLAVDDGGEDLIGLRIDLAEVLGFTDRCGPPGPVKSLYGDFLASCASVSDSCA